MFMYESVCIVFLYLVYVGMYVCIVIIIIISNLSNDRSKASSKTIPPPSAICDLEFPPSIDSILSCP